MFCGEETCIRSRSKSILNDLHVALRNQKVEAVRVLNRYDLENVDEEDYIAAKYTILSEPQVDFFYEEAPTPDYDEYILCDRIFTWTV